MPKTEEQKKQEIEEGNKEEEVYSEEGREVLKEEEDEITGEEEGFMKGYEEGEKAAICQTCKKVLDDNDENVVEIDYKGDTYRFCSEECAEKFTKKRKQ